MYLLPTPAGLTLSAVWSLCGRRGSAPLRTPDMVRVASAAAIAPLCQVYIFPIEITVVSIRIAFLSRHACARMRAGNGMVT